MRPKPITPSRLPNSSTPAKDLRSQVPAFIARSAGARFRERASISATASSAVAMELPPGEFMTRTPRRVAAWRSTLSTPTPARPITFRFRAASITCAFIWLPLRTRIAW